MLNRFEVHSHTEYSNLRLKDCKIKVEDLIDKAIEMGLSGIAITDHECLSAAPRANFYSEKIHKNHPNFKVAIGDEIYLCPDRQSGQKYYHFILIAKNAQGWRALTELSTRAWLNSFTYRRMERVVTTYQDLWEKVQQYPNSLIATTACLGGELSTQTLKLIEAEKIGNQQGIKEAHDDIVNFITFCKNLFGNDFYIECAPGASKEQIAVNQRLLSIAAAFEVKMVIGTDAHYLTPADREVHKAYLNSKDGEREVDAFYMYSYLQTEEEIFNNLTFDEKYIKKMYANSMEIYDKIENYSLRHKQTIPKVDVKDYPIPTSKQGDYMENNFPILCSMIRSTDKVERYWVNECLSKLNELGKMNDTYLARLEEEADIKRTIGEKLETNMFAYPVTLQHYVDMFWESGSTVGAGRGSSCAGLNHYLLGVTQIDPIEYNLPFFRYLNKERVELGDIDIDISPSKRPIILKKIRKERGLKFKENIDDLSRRHLGCTLIATFSTESAKSAIQTACRGYRSEEYPNGIDVDESQYIASLIPNERGFNWTIQDLIYGNEEKGRKPLKSFINAVSQYKGLLEIILGIDGLIKQRGSHASGVILFDEDPYEFCAFMRTPSGDVITQFDLHECEAMGMTKYDFLVTDVQDKIITAIDLMKKDNIFNKDLSLRQIYDTYFAPSVLPLDREDVWKNIEEGNILNVFQFDSVVGAQAAKKIKPRTIQELSDANGLMRLMTAEKGSESPLDKYVRFKNNIDLWYQEMYEEGLTWDEMKILEPYFKESYGVPPSQEQLMLMLMDKNICNFSLAEANAARKIVGKKQMEKIPELRAKVLKQASSPKLGQYVWKFGAGPQMGYSFSVIHALAYSFIGYQTAYIATNWNPIYWNTACLIVNSASLEDNSEEEINSLYKNEDSDYSYEDLSDRSEKKKKTSSTDYGKTARALGDIIAKGIKISLIDINKSDYSFSPDVENNQILYGLNAVSGINKEIIEAIKRGRPYSGIKDFMMRCPLSKTAMIPLIMSGAFDTLDEKWFGNFNVPTRIAVMVYYISIVSEPKKRLTLQNLSGLIKYNLIPDSLKLEIQIFNFNKVLKKCKYQDYYRLNTEMINFYQEHFDSENIEMLDNGGYGVNQKVWEKIYQSYMNNVRDYITSNYDNLLSEYNRIIFMEMWNKYKGDCNLSAWEMKSLCFYYHEHELASVNKKKYGIVDFNTLSPDSEVDYYWKKNGRDIPIYKTYIIIGTVIDKNDIKSSISLLTTTGVVTVKFTKEYYSMFNKQISEIGDDGKKHVIEKGWMSRGTKLMITGFRREDTFVAKTYSKTTTHQLYKIENLDVNGNIYITHERKGIENV